MQNTLRVYTEGEGTGGLCTMCRIHPECTLKVGNWRALYNVQNTLRVYTEGEGAGGLCTMCRIHSECTLKVRELEVFVQCAEYTQSVH